MLEIGFRHCAELIMLLLMGTGAATTVVATAVPTKSYPAPPL
jgi:hypothetical protein